MEHDCISIVQSGTYPAIEEARKFSFCFHSRRKGFLVRDETNSAQKCVMLAFELCMPHVGLYKQRTNYARITARSALAEHSSFTVPCKCERYEGRCADCDGHV